jgi:hypothetical protein
MGISKVIFMSGILLLSTAVLSLRAQASSESKFECVGDNMLVYLSFESGVTNGRIEVLGSGGYPPLPLVDATLDAGTMQGSTTRFVSAPNATSEHMVAKIDVPTNALTKTNFPLALETSYHWPVPNGALKVKNYKLNCVQQ